MVWMLADISIGKVTEKGWWKDVRVTVPAPKKHADIKSISIDGEAKDVESWFLDERDNILKITLADAGKSKETNDVSESIKGSS